MLLAAAHSVPSIPSAYPAHFDKPLRSRSKASVLPSPSLKPGPKLNTAIHELLCNFHKLGSKVEKKVIGLACQLIATKHLFQTNTSESANEPWVFNWRKPIRHIVISRRGVANYLQKISPQLAEDPNVVSGICDIANHGEAGDSFRDHLKNSPLKALDVNAAPDKWSLEDLFHVTELGKWNAINLDEINLENVKVTGLDLSFASIQRAKLHNADITDTNLEGTNLTGSKANCCKFIRTNLRRAILTSIEASHAVFTDSDLSGIQADKDAFFLQTDFSGARTDQAILTDSHIEYSEGLSLRQTTMTGAQMQFAKMTFAMKDKDYRNLEGFVARQLRAIGTIPSEDVQITLLNELIEGSGAKHDRPENIDLFAETLLTRKGLWKDEQLRQFIADKFLQKFLLHWNTSNENRGSVTPADVLAFIASTGPKLDWKKYGGAICQMLIDAEVNQHDMQRDALCALLMTDPTIAKVNVAMQEHGLEPFQDHSVFVSPDGRHAIVYPTSHVLAMMAGEGSPFRVGMLFVHDTHANFVQQPLQSTDVIKRCGVPAELFYIDPAPAAAQSLFELMFPGHIYLKAFIYALTSISLSMRPDILNPRTGQPDHYGVSENLGKFQMRVGGVSFIDWEEADALRQTVVDSGIELNGDSRGRVSLLLCLSALFLGAASPDLLGAKPALKKAMTEFSYACIRSASLLNKNLLPESEREISRYIEEDGTFSRIIRSANLAKYTDEERPESSLREILNLISTKSASDPELARCFKGIFPQAWMPEPLPSKGTTAPKP